MKPENMVVGVSLPSGYVFIPRNCNIIWKYFVFKDKNFNVHYFLIKVLAY